MFLVGGTNKVHTVTYDVEIGKDLSFLQVRTPLHFILSQVLFRTCQPCIDSSCCLALMFSYFRTTVTYAVILCPDCQQQMIDGKSSNGIRAIVISPDSYQLLSVEHKHCLKAPAEPHFLISVLADV